MKTVVVTGTDRGLGLSLADSALRAGNFVFATCLDPQGEGPRSLVERQTKRRSWFWRRSSGGWEARLRRGLSFSICMAKIWSGKSSSQTRPGAANVVD